MTEGVGSTMYWVSKQDIYVLDQLVGFDENGTHLSGPPLELMDNIPGYEGISFDSCKYSSLLNVLVFGAGNVKGSC